MSHQLSWYNDPSLKARAIAGYEKHIKNDTLIKGFYYTRGATFKGCHIGCILHDLGGDKNGFYYTEYARVTGNPKWLASLVEHFFERLPHPYNQRVSLKILKTIPVGKDLTPAYHKFMIWLLTNDIYGLCADETQEVVSLHLRCLNGDNPAKEEWVTALINAKDNKWARTLALVENKTRVAALAKTLADHKVIIVDAQAETFISILEDL